MIKKLRVKFIIINMLLVGAVLLIVFMTFLYSNYKRFERDSSDALFRALEEKGRNEAVLPEIKKKPPKSNTAFSTVPIFSVEVTENGEILSVFYKGVSISETDLKKVVEEAVQNPNQSGTINEYKLRYLKAEHNRKTYKIAFADRQNEIAMMQNLAASSLLIGVFGMLAFFFITLFLSAWALKPAEKAWQQQKQFIADASHELKTPLTVILTNNKILSDNPDKTIAEQKKWVDNTAAEGKRMKKLIDDLLFLAKSDTVNTAFVYQKINLSDTLWSALLPFESLAYENGIQLHFDIGENISVHGNDGQLLQLFSILIDNACKYAGEKGYIHVTLHQTSKSEILLCVQNNGEPINHSDLPHIFDRFYRGDKSRVHKQGSFGLGLAIAKSLAEVNRAKIWAESDAENGTKFYVKFKGPYNNHPL